MKGSRKGCPFCVSQRNTDVPAGTSLKGRDSLVRVIRIHAGEKNFLCVTAYGIIVKEQQLGDFIAGMMDALNAQKVPFGMERLLETLHRIPHSPQAAQEVLHLLSRSVAAYCEGVEPFDDMAALVLFMTDT